MFRIIGVGEWTGATEDKNLFLFWKQIQHDLSEAPGESLADSDISQTPTLLVANNDKKQIKDIVTVPDFIQKPSTITALSETYADASNDDLESSSIEMAIFLCAI